MAEQMKTPEVRTEDPKYGEAGTREGITAWANRLWNGPRRTAGPVHAAEGVYVFTEEGAQVRRETGGEVFTAPDGYVRRSPVQEMAVPADYGRRRARKMALVVCGAALALLGGWLLLHMQVIGL